MLIKKNIIYFIVLFSLFTVRNSFAQNEESGTEYDPNVDIRSEVFEQLKPTEENNPQDVLFFQKDNLDEIRDLNRDIAENFPLVLQTKNYDKISYYLKKGANINLNIYDKNTAVHIAANHGDVNYLEFLKTKKANLLAVNNNQQNILSLSSYKSNLSFAEKVKELLSEKDFKNMLLQKDKYGRTPLHNSILYGHLLDENQREYISFLIQNGVNINEKENDGKTALHYAVYLDRWEALAFMIKMGGNLKETANDGISVQDAIKEHFNLFKTAKIYRYLDNDGKKFIEEKYRSINRLDELVPYGYSEAKAPETLKEKSSKAIKVKKINKPSRLSF